MSELVVVSEGGNGACRGLDRRAAVRYHCDLEIACSAVPESEDANWIARVQDISTTGMGLVVDRYFEPETFLAVELQSDEPVLSYTFLVQVVHARAKSDREWLLGCIFARELSNAELRALL